MHIVSSCELISKIGVCVYVRIHSLLSEGYTETVNAGFRRETGERVGGTQSPFPILSEFVNPVHTSLLKKD